MINFIDDAKGATYVKFIKNKSDVLKAIKEFLQECKTSVFKLPVNDNTTFYSDGEAIYKSKNVKEVLDIRIIYTRIIPRITTLNKTVWPKELTGPFSAITGLC